MGQVYRDAVRIHNRGSAAMKATLSLPHAVQPFLQAQPIAGFCQVCLQPVDASFRTDCFCLNSSNALQVCADSSCMSMDMGIWYLKLVWSSLMLPFI